MSTIDEYKAATLALKTAEVEHAAAVEALTRAMDAPRARWKAALDAMNAEILRAQPVPSEIVDEAPCSKRP